MFGAYRMEPVAAGAYLPADKLRFSLELEMWQIDGLLQVLDRIFGMEICRKKCHVGGKRKLGAHAMKCVAAGAHLLTPRLFEPAKKLLFTIPVNIKHFSIFCPN